MEKFYIAPEGTKLHNDFTAWRAADKELVKIAKEFYHADMILLHDDMGSQKNAFFSPQLYRELLLPHYQKLTKAAHDEGMYVTLHSCGNVGVHIQNFIDAGFDAWEGQESANDMASIMEEYGKDLAQLFLYIIPATMSTEDAVADIHRRVDTLAMSGRWACRLRDEKPDREVNLADELYRYSRLKYLEKAEG